eukprot:755389-Hanusia_phi.AAC.1
MQSSPFRTDAPPSRGEVFSWKMTPLESCWPLRIPAKRSSRSSVALHGTSLPLLSLSSHPRPSINRANKKVAQKVRLLLEGRRDKLVHTLQLPQAQASDAPAAAVMPLEVPLPYLVVPGPSSRSSGSS